MNGIWKFIQTRSKKTTLNIHVKFWESIDEMPMYNWQKCADGVLMYVNKDVIDDVRNKDKYDLLYDQYLHRFGLTKEFEKYMNLLRDRALKQCKYVETKKRFTLTEIEIIEAKIERLNVNFGDGQSIEQSCVHVSKWLGYRMNLKEISVVEFYTIINEYGKWANKT